MRGRRSRYTNRRTYMYVIMEVLRHAYSAMVIWTRDGMSVGGLGAVAESHIQYIIEKCAYMIVCSNNHCATLTA